MATVTFVLALLSGRAIALGWDNGLARSPPMGWNPYNVFACNTTESDYRTAADALVQSGLKDLGYNYLVMDCGWHTGERDSNGVIICNSTKIPSGMLGLGNYVQDMDLYLGIISDAGYYACDRAGGWEHWAGSYGYEATDAMTFSSWSASYLKYTNCFVVNNTDFIDWDPPISEETLFLTMKQQLDNTNMVYAIDEWGIQDPARWSSQIAHSWRIANNLESSFADLQRVINQVVPITGLAGPGGWNDLDLLQVGNAGLTEAEWKTNFAFWAAAKSPLFISTGLTDIAQNVLDILSNKWLIEINQDSLGRSIDFKRRYTDDYDIWAGPLKDGSIVALLLNWKNTTRSITFNFSDIGASSGVLTDLWNGTTVGVVNGSYTDTVDAHGALAYKLSDPVDTTTDQYHTYVVNASNTVLGGGASLREFTPGAYVAGNIGYNGTLTLVGVDGGAKGGAKLMQIVYINGDYTFTNTACSNCRRVEVSLNGGTPVVAEMPLSAMSWNITSAPYLFSLGGFVPGNNNNITFSNPNAWAPDIFSVAVRL